MADQHSENRNIPEDHFLKLLWDAAKGPVFSAEFASTQPNIYGGLTQSSPQDPAYSAGQVSGFPLPLPDYFADLPLEVSLDILKRLPVKSIGISRCLSKTWLSLLTNYEFIKAHLAHHTHLALEQKLLLRSVFSLCSLTLHQSHVSHLRKLEFDPEGEIELVGACNGLVLVSFTAKVYEMWVINCMTQEFVKLNVSPFPLCPHHSFSKYGLWYDELSDDYKIVKISQCDFTAMGHCPEAEIFVDIYSLKMKSWRRLGNPLYVHDFLDRDYCMFINGAFHWIGLKFKYTPKESAVIGSFDLSHEKFKEFPVPASLNDDSIFLSARLMVIDGCLGIWVCINPQMTEIWLMRSYSMVESWTKIVVDFRPLCSLQDRILFKEKRDGVLKWYCVKDGSVEVCLAVDDPGLRCLSVGIAYTESLVSPHFNYHNSKVKGDDALNLAAIGRI